MQVINGAFFAVTFIFCRVYLLGLASWIAVSECLQDPVPVNPFNSSTAPGGGYILQDSYFGHVYVGAGLTTGLWLVSLTWLPPVIKGLATSADSRDDDVQGASDPFQVSDSESLSSGDAAFAASGRARTQACRRP